MIIPKTRFQAVSVSKLFHVPEYLRHRLWIQSAHFDQFQRLDHLRG